MEKWFVFMMCFFGWATATSLQAQQMLKGIVSGGDKPLQGATVATGNQTTITDSAGYFQLPVQPGKNRLQVTMTGFERKDTAVFFKDEKEKEITIQLQTYESLMGEVVVIGTLKPVQKLQSPIAVEVYSAQFFKKNPTPSVFESLQNINGVRPQINCSVCNTGDIHINGLEGPYTMVTIDGMPIIGSLSSVYGLFGIPSNLIEKIEIIKGPASGLYGSEAIGGVINIITKSPEKSPAVSFQALSTSWLEHNVNLGLRFNLGKATSLLGIDYYNFQREVDLNKDNFTDVTLQHRASVFNKWSLTRKSRKVATMAGRFFWEDRWGGEMNWNASYKGSDSIYGESIGTRRWELMGNYELPLIQKVLFSFSATGHRQTSYYGRTPYHGDQKIVFGQLLWEPQKLGAQNMLVGVAGRYNFYDDNSTATIDTATKMNKPDQVFLPGMFVQNEWKWKEKHTLLAGLRYDYHPVHHSIITPRLAYKWSPTNHQVVRLNAGTGFRVVNLFTEDHAALTGARVVEIREALQPEKSYNVNLNFSQQWNSRNHRGAFDVSLWYSYFHNQIIADYETDPNKIIYQNLKGYATSNGLTVNVELNLFQRLKGVTGFTLQNITNTQNENGRKVKQQPVLTERWSGTWTLSYSLPLWGVNIDYTGNVYGPMRLPLISALDPRPAKSGVYSIQNIQLTKIFNTQWEVFGGVKNLLNWTPGKNIPFLIARSHDPFDKKVAYGANGEVLSTAENPYALTFDPSYVYASNQGIRFFTGFRYQLKK